MAADLARRETLQRQDGLVEAGFLHFQFGNDSIQVHEMNIRYQSTGLEGILKTKKPQKNFRGSFLKINRATSYSPTHLRMQYHRG